MHLCKNKEQNKTGGVEKRKVAEDNEKKDNSNTYQPHNQTSLQKRQNLLVLFEDYVTCKHAQQQTSATSGNVPISRCEMREILDNCYCSTCE